uniref:Reverse transcriptase domain-containing protein n=1 Tax=Schistocephalus solidus TaxID=70667 RepID=A0A183SYC2_SCHSO
LGLSYSSGLNLSEHYALVVSKACQTTGFILRNYKTVNIRTSLYKMFVRPTLEYCLFLFSLLHASYIFCNDSALPGTQIKHVRSGVIEGSGLSPLLFCFFVNDVPDCFKYGRPFMYNDDLEVAFFDINQPIATSCLSSLKRVSRPSLSGLAHGAFRFLGKSAALWLLATTISPTLG